MKTIYQAIHSGPVRIELNGSLYEFTMPDGNLPTYAIGRKVKGFGRPTIQKNWTDKVIPF